MRLKQNIDDPNDVSQWCRMAIVIDSEIPEIKYLLELMPEGFVKTEYIKRLVELRAKGQVFAIKRLRAGLTKRQSNKLRVISDFLATDLSPASGNYKKFYELKKEDLKYVDVENQPGNKKRKEMDDVFRSKDQSSHDHSGFSDEEEENDYEEPAEYLEIVRMALIDTRRILETLDEDGNVYNQLWEIFKMFSGNLTMDLNESYHSSMESENSNKLVLNAKENKDNVKKTMHILTLS